MNSFFHISINQIHEFLSVGMNSLRVFISINISSCFEVCTFRHFLFQNM